MGKDLIYEVIGRTALLTINREKKRNAITQEMITSFLEYLDRAERNNDVRAVCLTGAGEKAFCAGADLAGSLSAEDSGYLSGAERYAELLKRFSKFPKPMVARVNGPCLAGGIGLMLSCDIVIARNDAFFSTPEVNVGIFPMMVGALLKQNVTRKKAMEMVLTGRRVSAEEAEKMGLITQAVEPGHLDEEVQKTLKFLIGNSPTGIRMGKEAFRVMGELPFDEAVDYLCQALARVTATEDAKEGMNAFLQKRPPDFKGR
jgi:enoyl-CoA hydratase/carnithine racemase